MYSFVIAEIYFWWHISHVHFSLCCLCQFWIVGRCILRLSTRQLRAALAGCCRSSIYFAQCQQYKTTTQSRDNRAGQWGNIGVAVLKLSMHQLQAALAGSVAGAAVPGWVHCCGEGASKLWHTDGWCWKEDEEVASVGERLAAGGLLDTKIKRKKRTQTVFVE